MPKGAPSSLYRLAARRPSLVAKEARHRTIFSFVIDTDPKFAYQGYHLARSLIENCGAEASAVHAQCTPEVSPATRRLFAGLGCTLHDAPRVGDGRYCNKVGQLDNLLAHDFGRAVLLDTDMIAVADLRPYLGGAALQAKPVDLSNPSLDALEEVAWRAGMPKLPPRIATDAEDAETYLGNCNGGLYAIPKALCPEVAAAWRHWTLWLLANADPLAREGKEAHLDQVAMWLVINMGQIPFQAAPSNINYFTHMATEHRHLDPSREIALLHYHDVSLNMLGLLEPPIPLNCAEKTAIAKANRQIGCGFENYSFWDLRYSSCGERGSGVGSRGDSLTYKRVLLREQGAEQAKSVLDFGCGDLEVVKILDLKGYLGLDSSERAIRVAQCARPDWAFERLAFGNSHGPIPPKHLVICFEVLIHQPTRRAYQSIIKFLADHTLETLIVSGYDSADRIRRPNHMLFFHEPLEASLQRTGRFRSIRRIGAHTDVVIVRCDT